MARGFPADGTSQGVPVRLAVTHGTSRRTKLLRGCKTVSRACRRSAGTGGNPVPGSPGCDVEESVRVRMDADKAAKRIH